MKCVKIPKNQKCKVEFVLEAKPEDQVAICICISEEDMKKLANNNSILPALKAGERGKWLSTLPAAIQDLLEKIYQMQINAKAQGKKD